MINGRNVTKIPHIVAGRRHNKAWLSWTQLGVGSVVNIGSKRGGKGGGGGGIKI